MLIAGLDTALMTKLMMNKFDAGKSSIVPYGSECVNYRSDTEECTTGCKVSALNDAIIAHNQCPFEGTPSQQSYDDWCKCYEH